MLTYIHTENEKRKSEEPGQADRESCRRRGSTAGDVTESCFAKEVAF